MFHTFQQCITQHFSANKWLQETNQVKDERREAKLLIFGLTWFVGGESTGFCKQLY